MHIARLQHGMAGHGKVAPEAITHWHFGAVGLNDAGTAPHWHYAPVIFCGVKLPVANTIAGYRVADVIGGESKPVYGNHNLTLGQRLYRSGDLLGYSDVGAVGPKLCSVRHCLPLIGLGC